MAYIHTVFCQVHHVVPQMFDFGGIVTIWTYIHHRREGDGQEEADSWSESEVRIYDESQSLGI